MTALPEPEFVDEDARVPELAISHWWRNANLNEPLATSDGRRVRIVFRGIWSHGSGPDFKDAMVAFDDAELHSGSIEIHRDAEDWYRHGHDRDPAYNSVVLHVVLSSKGSPTRCADGRLVPQIVAPVSPSQLRATHNERWSMVGGSTCAEALTSDNPQAVRSAVNALGDLRLGHKSARIEARLSSQEPGEVLYQEIMETLGYTANREAMRTLAARVTLQSINAIATTIAQPDRQFLAAGAYLGTGGFLPLSPQLQEAAGLSVAEVSTIESLWRTRLGAWHGSQLAPTAWNLTRVRPLNHPVRRLLAAGQLVTWNDGNLLYSIIEQIRTATPVEAALIDVCTWNGDRLLGDGRARAVTTNAILPFSMAFAAVTGDDELSEATSRVWESLPAEEPNQVTRRAERQIGGESRIGHWGARGMQGLIHLDSTLCGPRRCYECPIAHLVVESQI